ncbi:rCG61592 [Rattus norvegicus]|uniref:RCG61592 n=1 Tax=Rattus norvegicus TaxID=10116 RepID=A6HAN1_RAT|nr:rCG61592 [Rattus norvegicus]
MRKIDDFQKILGEFNDPFCSNEEHSNEEHSNKRAIKNNRDSYQHRPPLHTDKERFIQN